MVLKRVKMDVQPIPTAKRHLVLQEQEKRLVRYPIPGEIIKICG